MKVTEKAQQALDGILSAFESGQVPEAIAHTVIPMYDAPCNRWSLNNRILTFLSGTTDARGIDQWRQIGRWPKKGSKALYILVPMIYTKRDDERGIDENALIGFRACPVFRLEDTDGKPLDRPQVEPPEPPPLLDIALAWGLSVRYLPCIGNAYGFYCAGRQEIGLCPHDEAVFFHELAHAAHDRVNGGLSQVQKWKKEVVAELTAATLMHLFGRRPNDGGAYRYIRHYAAQDGKDPHRACLAVIADVSRCLDLILKAKQTPVIEAIAAD
ncbi:MAG: hypothetical protein EXS64_16055 [Candidatus Latescibacteria bacterium]|nr:hypothetical protein [Candidatus Latescibacterota bacterium]